MVSGRAGTVATSLMVGFLVCVGQTMAQKSTPAKGDPAQLREMTLHVIPQAHIDLAWWWRYDPETIHVVTRRTLEMAFENLEAFPDYTFTFLQVPAIEPIEKHYPDLFYKLHYFIFNSPPMSEYAARGRSLPNPHGTDPEQGRIRIASGFWDELDASLPSGESIVRQCVYGKRYFKREFGLNIKSAWFQDAWTHPWTYPQILKKCGIDSYMFTRGEAGANDERMFWWQSPDGSRVFAYKPAGRGEPMMREHVEQELAEVSKRYGVKDHIVLVGIGNHGGGLGSKDIAEMRRTMSQITADAKFSTHTKFLSAVLKERHNFPVVDYEISPTIRGAYTTVGEIKKLHRQSENLLLTLEKFSSMAAQMGLAPYPGERVTALWEKLMLNQSHDAISGTTISPATDDALDLFREIIATGNQELQESFGAISAMVDTSGPGVPVVVFNPLSWERSDVAELELKLGEPADGMEVVDTGGNAVPVQLLGSEVRNGDRQKITFLAEGIPSLGYKTYHVVPTAAKRVYPTTLRASDLELENEFFRVKVDPATGCVSSIFDKQNRREALDKSRQGNLIQVIEDFGDSEGFLWAADGKTENNQLTGKSWNIDREPRVRLLESGPVRAVIEVKKQWELSRFTQRIILYHSIPRIDFELDIAWNGKNKMVKVAFPVGVSAREATYEIPYGNISRPSLGEEHVAQKWVDVSDQSYGVSLLNDSRYGYDVKDNVIRLSVLRSPTSPVFSTDERGIHSLRYALSPHRGDWRTGDTIRRGYELNNSLRTFLTAPHSGILPPSHSFITVEPKNVIIEALKKAEDTDSLILRLYECEGSKSIARISWSEPVDAVHEVDLLETSLREVLTDGKSIQVPVSPYSIDSYKLIKDKKWIGELGVRHRKS